MRAIELIRRIDALEKRASDMEKEIKGLKLKKIKPTRRKKNV